MCGCGGCGLVVLGVGVFLWMGVVLFSVWCGVVCGDFDGVFVVFGWVCVGV